MNLGRLVQLFGIAMVFAMFIAVSSTCQSEKPKTRNSEPAPPPPPSSTVVETAPPQPIAAGVDAVTANKDTPVLDAAGGEPIGTLPSGASVFYQGDAGKFYEVNLYPGRPSRFILKSDATRQSVTPIMPEEQLSRDAYAAVINGETRAIEERPMEAVPSDASRVEKDRQMDRYVLEGLNELGVSPLDADLACNRGMKENWPPH